MKITPQCIPCLLDRVLYESRLCTGDEEKIMEAMRASVNFLSGVLDPSLGTVAISTGVHRAAFSVLGDIDAYAEKKELSNRIAKQILPKVVELVASGSGELELFRNAVLASIVSNSLDFGVSSHHVEEDDFWSYFIAEYRRGLQVDHTNEIFKRSCGRVLYLFDNCGEIYLDALVLKLLKKRASSLTGVVRGGPILNDALLSDAGDAGINEIVDELLTTGGNAIGIKEDEAPRELLVALRESDIVISKGMANYETLTEMDGLAPVAYLMRTKCWPVASSLGVEKDNNVAMLLDG